MRSIGKLTAGLHGCAGKKPLSTSIFQAGTYSVYDSETEESAEEYHKLSSLEDVSCTPWTSKAEVNSRTSLRIRTMHKAQG
jgi:hypothetical protein